LFIGGAISIVLFKLLAALFLPLLGAFVGLLMMTVKLALVAAVIYFLYTVFFKRKRDEAEVEG
jgi:hypothetical protein